MSLQLVTLGLRCEVRDQCDMVLRLGLDAIVVGLKER